MHVCVCACVCVLSARHRCMQLNTSLCASYVSNTNTENWISPSLSMSDSVLPCMVMPISFELNKNPLQLHYYCVKHELPVGHGFQMELKKYEDNTYCT